jgi:thiol-disulfide isomerase/thioredoxin
MQAEPAKPEPDRQGPSRRYSTFVGLAFLVLIAVATLNTIRTQGGGILGTGSDERGMPLPEFAVPNARTGPLNKDANIAQDDCSTSQNPCPSSAQRPPACEIEVKGAIRVCDLFDRPLVLSFWFTRGATCLPTQDIVDRVASRYRGRVNFLSIDVRDDPGSVRNIVEERGWKLPVGYDRDGAVSDLYRVGGCPTVAFAYPGGILAFARVDAARLSQPHLVSDVRTLVRESRNRAALDR